MLCVSRLLIPTGILSVWVLGNLGTSLAQSSPVVPPSGSVASPSGPSTQSSRPIPDSHALADAIVQHGVMLNAASSVTDSSLTQYERRVPQRRKTKMNMSLGVPTILAILVMIAGAIRLRATLAGRRRRILAGRNIAEECRALSPMGAPVRVLSGVASEVSIASESCTEDERATSSR
jgi:hypothetical protein